MNNLAAEKRLDKNGKLVTRHVKTESAPIGIGALAASSPSLTASPKYPPLPQLPKPMGRNTVHVNTTHNTEPSERFWQNTYGKYEGSPHYEDAKKFFLTSYLKQAEVGINSYHERILGGHIKYSDLKAVGIVNLKKHRGRSEKFIMEALTTLDGKQDYTGQQIRAMIDHAKETYLLGDVTMLAAYIGVDHAVSTDNFAEVMNHSQSRNVISAVANNEGVEATREYVAYVDEFFGKIKEKQGSAEYIKLKNAYGLVYNGEELLQLQQNNVSVDDALYYMVQNTFAEVAIEIHKDGIQKSLSGGYL